MINEENIVVWGCWTILKQKVRVPYPFQFDGIRLPQFSVTVLICFFSFWAILLKDLNSYGNSVTYILSCPSKSNSKLIELPVHTSCYWGLKLTLCYLTNKLTNIRGRQILKFWHSHFLPLGPLESAFGPRLDLCFLE